MQAHVVDIRTDDVQDNIITPLQLDYDLFMCRILAITQEGWKVEPGTPQDQLSLGPLDSSYRLYEIHGHMAGDPGLESCRRHSVDGKEYAGELHLLHYNPLMNYSPNKVLSSPPDHKVVICLLLEEGKINNELSKLIEGLSELSYEVKKFEIQDDVNPTVLLPENLAYWMYKEERLGENKKETTWIIFKNPIEASEEQINAMRSPNGQASAVATIPPQSERIISEGLAVFKRSDSKCSEKCCPCF